MPKRRVRQVGQRRLGRGSRDHLRLIREFGAAPLHTTGDGVAPPLASVHELNPPPNIGDTIVVAQDYSCASCPGIIAEGTEGTWIDDELNCADCTQEARRG